MSNVPAAADGQSIGHGPATLAGGEDGTSTVDLSVVIVTTNERHWLTDCLHTLARQLQDLSAEVIVVDNASQDDSAELVHDLYPRARIVRNQSPVGFSQANNRGCAVARGRYIMLLNPDTLFHDGLAQMLDLLAANPRAGAVSPIMLDQHGQPRDSWGHFPSLKTLAFTMLLLDRVQGLRRLGHPVVVHPRHPEFAAGLQRARRVDWVCGACLLTSRPVLDAVGPLDEGFVIYSEDADWCYRARQAGYESWVTPAATITHFGAGGREWHAWKGPGATLNAYSSFLYFHRKHSPVWRQLLVRLVLAVGAVLRLVTGLVFTVTMRGQDRERAWGVVQAYAQVAWLMLSPSGRT